MYSGPSEKITSGQNPLVKHLVKLRTQKKYRAEVGTTLVSGERVIQELTCPLKTVLATEKRAGAIHITPELAKKITGLPAPEGVIAEVAIPPPSPLTETTRLLVLDRIRDPGNAGTLVRTALALGWDGLFLLDSSVDLFNDKTIRASKGGTLRLPYRYGRLVELTSLLDRFQTHVATLEGTPPQKCAPPAALILGSEADGLSPEVARLGTPTSIPMPGPMESLNVAVAGGILMYEMCHD